MTALRVLVDENLAQRAEILGEKFRSAVRAINSPLVKLVRGRGLLNAVVMDEDKSTRGRTAWQFCLLLKSRGVLAKPTHINMYALTYSALILPNVRSQHPVCSSASYH
jgi:ornithine--oxo-acid transaminase